ncbi:MAG: hypothetical protein AAFY41_17010, partial [Bacteroidota bacterium]
MNIPEEQFKLIVKYIDKDLRDNEKELFDELMLSSEPFREELIEVELIIASIKAIGHRKNVQRVRGVMQKLDEQKKKENRQNLKAPIRLSIAASITAILIFAYLGITQKDNTSPETIYQTYFE